MVRWYAGFDLHSPHGSTSAISTAQVKAERTEGDAALTPAPSSKRVKLEHTGEDKSASGEDKSPVCVIV